MAAESQPTTATSTNAAQSDPCKDCAGNFTWEAPGCNGSTNPHPGSSCSAEPVRYSNGEVYMIVEDLRFKSFGVDWGHTRSYSNQVTKPDEGVNGNSWFVKEWPHLVASNLNPLNPNAPGTLCLVWVIQEALWFDYNAGSYVARFNIRPKLRHDSANKQFTLLDSEGRLTKFFDFDPIHPSDLRGQFKSFTDASGREIVASYGGDHLMDSFVQQVGTESSGYYYSYHTTGVNAGRLEEVLYKVNGVPVRRAQYSYYGSDDAHGSAGDLELVAIADYQGSWSPVGKTYYRYYKTTSAVGIKHGLRFVVSPLGYRRMEEEGITPEIATDEQIASFAKHEFRYAGSTGGRGVSHETVNSGTSNYGFAVTQSAFADGPNNWKHKTVEDLPDGSRRLIYTNYSGQVILSVFIEMEGGVETARRWYEYQQYDSAGRTLLRAESSAVQSYSEASSGLVTLRNAEGIIHLFEFYSATPGTGGAPNRLRYESIKKGASGTPVKLKEKQYVGRTVGSDTLYWPWKETVFRSEDGGGSDPLTTTYSYTWSHFQVVEKTTTWPVVLTTQNGSGSADFVKEAFDAFGRLAWHTDERGYITAYSHDPATDAVIQRIDDVAGGAPWPVLSGTHLNLVTDFDVDRQGRAVQERGPVDEIDVDGVATEVRRTRWIIYHDATFQRWEGNGYQKVSDGSFTLINPVSIWRRDDASRLIDEIQAKRVDEEGNEDVDGPLLPTDTFAQDSWVRWARNDYLGYADVANRRVYFLIPESGAGTRDVNYNQSDYQYDILHRMVRDRSPGGTITRYVYDSRGSMLSKWVGTNDAGATDTDPAEGGSPLNNMVKVEEYQYDGGLAGMDGNRTRVTKYADETDLRVTHYGYDWRNRRTNTDGEIDFFEAQIYDSLGQVIRIERKDTTATGTLVGLREIRYDNRGREYRTLRYAVNPQTGAIGAYPLAANSWYDGAGNRIKRQPEGTRAFIKTVYDAVNVPVLEYLALDADETAYADASSVADDTVIEQTEWARDAERNVIFETRRARFHNATGTGPLKEPTGAQPRARVSYEANWPDALGRVRTSANYGTNDGVTPVRHKVAPEVSTDDLLVTSTSYNASGEASQVTDAAGRVHTTKFDNMGRKIEEVQNVVETGTAADQNKTTLFTYSSDGLLATLTAKNSVTGDQITTWNYGTTLEASAVASTLLVGSKVYPDSSTDRVEYRYNRQGEQTELKDQRGTTHAYDYDKLARLLNDRVPVLGTNVDGSVRRISFAYDVRGLASSITSADNASSGMGAIVNQVVNTYNDFGQIIAQPQSHTGPVGSGTSEVRYEYETGINNTIRLKKTTYPNGRKIHYAYSSPGSNEDILNRVAALIDDDGVAQLATYQYLGISAFATVEYPEPGLSLIFGNDSNNPYAGWDSFGRIIDQRWLSGSAPVEHLTFKYDRASNCLSRRNVVALNNHDALYSYDDLNRLTSVEYGTLAPDGASLIGIPIQQEEVSFDSMGNWRDYVCAVDGGATITQNRQHNKNNALVSINNGILLSYDAVGSMTHAPQPESWSEGYTMTWDAWNRLITVQNTGGVLALYSYDGIFRRVTDTPEAGSCREFYHSKDWQILEERINFNAAAERQFVWGIRRIDDLILRDHMQVLGAIRLYGLSDRLSVTAVSDISGVIQERYEYSAFGSSYVLDPAFGSRAESAYEWETLFCGYRKDETTGLYHVRNRYYHSQLGRWISRDPVNNIELLRQSANLYAYVANQPSKWMDPTGLHCRDCQQEFDECNDAQYEWMSERNEANEEWYKNENDATDREVNQKKDDCIAFYGRNPAGNACAKAWDSVGGVYKGLVWSTYLTVWGLIQTEYAVRVAKCVADKEMCDQSYGYDSNGCPCEAPYIPIGTSLA